jgi:hypothetical protein
MSRRLRIALLGIIVIAYPLVSAAQVPPDLAGTWIMNVAKSKADPGPLARSQTSRWEPAPGGGARNIVETVTSAGNTNRLEMVTMFDGKPSELKGAAMPTTRTYTKVAGGYEFVDRVNGKVTTTMRVTIAADGKTRTNVATGVNAAGQRVNNVIVYERQ